MRVLLIKTSSMGDLIHTLPALTDAKNNIPNITFDWMVEDAFKEIPHWHPAVKKVFPVAIRQWRKNILSSNTRFALRALRQTLQAQPYDLILDAQGLVKSALFGFLAQGVRAGLDWKSARESLASLAYQRKYTVNFYQHAVVRMRSLFSLALDYPVPNTPPAFSLDRTTLLQATDENYLVFLHGTTWESKQWPEQYWIVLAKMAQANGFNVKIGGGNAMEVNRAQRIVAQASNVELRPYLKISEMAKLLANAAGAVAVDTGFGHLAAALDVPTVSIYGSTNPDFTGAMGKYSRQLATDFECSPCISRSCSYKKPAGVFPACYSTVKPEKVWENFLSILSSFNPHHQSN